MASAHGTLSRRLAASFAAVAVLTMIVAAVILGVLWAKQFDAYIEENLQQTANSASGLLAMSYAHSGGQWSFDQMPRYGLMSGLALQVLTPDGRVMYDDSVATAASEQMMGLPEGSARTPQGSVVTAPILIDGESVGVVRVWTLAPEGLLNENDLNFRRASFIGLGIAGLISVALASMAGMWFAVSLVRPIDRITLTAESLRGGDAHARTGMDGDDAISVLGRTFDEMADSIEADREMERRLTADVAHELRTPLQAIQATVEAMQDGVLPADEERLGIVRDETVRLGRLADGILELTRLERGSASMEMHRIELGGTVRAALDTHRILLDSVGLTVHVDIADGVYVLGDADRLMQAVGNLISNTARYTPEGGSVTVAVRAENDRAIVEVADTGIGISDEDSAHVFDRFWRADAARNRKTGGLGIGLAVVKEIVDRHGGTVGVSRRDVAGSVFTIRLPLAT